VLSWVAHGVVMALVVQETIRPAQHPSLTATHIAISKPLAVQLVMHTMDVCGVVTIPNVTKMDGQVVLNNTRVLPAAISETATFVRLSQDAFGVAILTLARWLANQTVLLLILVHHTAADTLNARIV